MPPAAIVPIGVYALFGVWGGILAVIDARTHRLPNRMVLPAYPVGCALLVIAELAGAQAAGLVTAGWAMVAAFTVFYLVALISPGSLGGGDVKLAGVLGLMLGWLGWPAVGTAALAAFLLAGAYALGMLVLRRADTGTRIPFGPFLIAGSWIAVATASPVP